MAILGGYFRTTSDFTVSFFNTQQYYNNFTSLFDISKASSSDEL